MLGVLVAPPAKQTLISSVMVGVLSFVTYDEFIKHKLDNDQELSKKLRPDYFLRLGDAGNAP